MSFNAPDIRQFKLTGSTVGDVHFPKVKALLPLNGSNGGTSATDESNSNATVTFQGSSTTSTAQSKFGGSSLYVPNSNPAGVYISGVGSTITFTGDFTVEWWIYRVQATAVSNQTVGPIIGTQSISDSSNATNYYVAMSIGYLTSSATEGKLYSSSNGSAWNVANGVSLGTGSAGTVGQWVHMALTRSGTTWSYYVDGTRTYTGTLGSDTLSTPGSYITLGKSWNTGGSFEAYYSDFRITQGLARYTGASVTVPTSAHLTSAGDANKQIIVNSDADGIDVGTGGINQARIAKAWVNYNGTGTIAINDSYNVSSLTDDATGKWDVNFSTAMSSVDFVAVCDGRYLHDDGTGSATPSLRREAPVTTKVGVRCHSYDGTAYDVLSAHVIVFGN